MSKLEKKFVLSHVIENVGSLGDEDHESPQQTHFGIPWNMEYYINHEQLSVLIKCRRPKEDEKWEVYTHFIFKLISPNGTKITLENDRCFGNTTENDTAIWGWFNFIKLDILEKFFVVDGKIRIETHVTIKKLVGFGMEKLKMFDESNEKYSDIILKVEDQKFFLSKLFLASQSPYFERLLFGNFEESKQSEVVLKGIDSEDFQSFLELIHGESSVNDSNIDGVLYLSDMFDVSTALRRCQEYLLEKSKWPAEEKLVLAEMYNLERLKNVCLMEINCGQLKEDKESQTCEEVTTDEDAESEQTVEDLVIEEPVPDRKQKIAWFSCFRT